VIAVVTLIATLFFVVWAWRMLSWGTARPQITPALGLPLSISQASILVGALGCAGFALRDLVRSLIALGGRE
jgi:TRAP-type C4-dicarboxylate transport system permease small subunit